MQRYHNATIRNAQAARRLKLGFELPNSSYYLLNRTPGLFELEDYNFFVQHPFRQHRIRRLSDPEFAYVWRFDDPTIGEDAVALLRRDERGFSKAYAFLFIRDPDSLSETSTVTAFYNLIRVNSGPHFVDLCDQSFRGPVTDQRQTTRRCPVCSRAA